MENDANGWSVTLIWCLVMPNHTCIVYSISCCTLHEHGLYATYSTTRVQAKRTHKNTTQYDVLQEDCRHDVKDKNLGDPAGDAYFNIKDM